MRFKGRSVLYVPGVVTVHVSTYATSCVRYRHSRGPPPGAATGEGGAAGRVRRSRCGAEAEARAEAGAEHHWRSRTGALLFLPL